MRCFFHLLRACLVWAALLSSARGGSLPESLARPPSDGVVDPGGFLRGDEAARKRISTKFRQLRDEHGYRMYLIVEPVFISTTAQELAARLQQAWLPEGNGLVIVFEGDSRSLGFGLNPGEKPGLQVAGALVPTHETAALLQEAVDSTDAGLAREAYVVALAENLAIGFGAYFDRRAAPAPPGRLLRFALLTIGGLALLALGTIGVGALARMQAVAGARVFRIPRVDRPERLGAPCGGAVTSRGFQPRERGAAF